MLLALVSLLFAATREVQNLVYDGVPEVPARITERTRQYNEVRSASFVDFDVNGTGMLISTRFGETAQLHHVAAPGYDRQQLTFYADAVAGGAWDPLDPDGLFVVLDQGGGEFFQIYRVDLRTGLRTLLTDGKSRNTGFSIAPKGGRFVYTSTRRNGKDNDLYLQVGNDPATVRLVAELPGDWTPVAWSPDETRLLMRHEVSVNDAELLLLDLATGKLDPLVPGHTAGIAWGSAVFSGDGRSVFATTDKDAEFSRLVKVDLATRAIHVITPDTAWDVSTLVVSRDGRSLAWEVNEGGRSALYLARADKPEKAKRIELPVGVIGAMAFDRRSTRLGITLSTTDSPGDAWTVDLTGNVTRWTRSEVGGLDPSRFVTPALIDYPTFDGKKIPAWYARPAAGGRVPVLIAIHGGPEAQTKAGFSSSVQYWVNELGVAVIQPNVRGSTGYGKTWTTLDNAERRMDSVKDIGALLDWIATQPDLDPERVAVLGGSYGGFMVLASMVEYGDRLRCGVDSVGISNFVTFLERTEAYRQDLRRVEYGDEREPVMRAFLEQIAPANHADRIKRPLLVGQGANDPRVPKSEADQIVAKVRAAGGTAWYILAKDEGHGFKKKSNRQAWQDSVSLFLETWLLPERLPTPPPAPLPPTATPAAPATPGP